MKLFTIIFNFIFISISISCTDSHTKSMSATSYNLNKDLKLSIDSVIIPLDSISLPMYLSCTSYYEDDTISLLYAFNPQTWNIDVFNLTKSEMLGHIALEHEGPNAINEVMALQAISLDSIFIYDGNKFIFMDDKGHVLSRINGSFEKDDCIAFLFYNPFSRPFFNKIDKKIYGHYVTTRPPLGFSEKELFASYDTKNNKWEIFNVEYPDYFTKIRDRLGRNTWLSADFREDRISYNFSALPDIFVFDFKNKKQYTSGGESKLMNNFVQFYSGDKNNSDEKWRHWLDNPNFNPIIYNPHQDLYYRISFGEFIGNHDYTNSGHYSKKIVISVFNSSLQLTYENILPNYQFNFNGYYSTSKGILTFGNNPLNPVVDPEKLTFYYLSVD